MKIGFVIGTRPEIIKICPLIRYCEENNIDHFLVHSGQHYSYNMDKLFFEELNIKQAKYYLKIKSSAPFRQGEHTGKMMIKIEDIFLEESPDVIFAHGDTNTALATALTASKITTTKSYTGREIKIAHIESGLRSYDRSMPEEINRQIIDHLSDFLFPPTENAKQNLIKEGLDHDNILVSGNTIVDSVFQNIKISEEKCNILKELDLKKDEYFLVTAHRQESVDVEERLRNIINALKIVQEKYGLKMIYPIHPRTKKMLEKFKIEVPETITIIDPVGFLEFLQLEKNSRLTLSDSGGVQEESCIFDVPCVTLRNNTERPEAVEVGANIIAGYDPEKIIDAVSKLMESDRKWENPFGDGKSAEKIIQYLSKKINK